LDHLVVTFNCQAGTMSFTYLGLPLSLNKPIVQDCMPLVHIMERRLISTSNFLTQGGKLTDGQFSFIFSCNILHVLHQGPIIILNQIDKYMRHCL
jgi:hypothetical protein